MAIVRGEDGSAHTILHTLIAVVAIRLRARAFAVYGWHYLDHLPLQPTAPGFLTQLSARFKPQQIIFYDTYVGG